MNTKRERDKEFEKVDREKEDKLIQTLCDFYGVNPGDLDKLQQGKGRVLSKIRTFVFYKLVTKWGYTQARAARVLSKSDWAVTVAMKTMEANKELMEEYNNVTEDL